GAAGAQGNSRPLKRLVLDGRAKNGVDRIAGTGGAEMPVFQAAADLKADFLRGPPVDARLQLFERLVEIGVAVGLAAVLNHHIAAAAAEADAQPWPELVVHPVERGPGVGILKTGDQVDLLVQAEVGRDFAGERVR